MTAAELFDAIQGVPAEALCNYLDYATYSNGQPHWRIGFMPTTDQIAAALQRDALTEWLIRNDRDFPMVPVKDGWFTDHKVLGQPFPTRLHALAAACRFVAGQKGADK